MSDFCSEQRPHWEIKWLLWQYLFFFLSPFPHTGKDHVFQPSLLSSSADKKDVPCRGLSTKREIQELGIVVLIFNPPSELWCPLTPPPLWDCVTVNDLGTDSQLVALSIVPLKSISNERLASLNSMVRLPLTSMRQDVTLLFLQRYKAQYHYSNEQPPSPPLLWNNN